MIKKENDKKSQEFILYNKTRDFNNVWDVLDVYKQKYGDEFILSPLE